MAQKYGHLNSGNLIAELPETKSADVALKSFQDARIQVGENMAKKFEAAYKAYVAEAQTGTLSPLQQQEREAALQKQQQELQAYEQKVVDEVTAKREALYQPILEKVQTAIDAVGKEKGYTMIFDTSILVNNPIVYAAEAEDVTALVKAKL